jgi:hypothetical protein
MIFSLDAALTITALCATLAENDTIPPEEVTKHVLDT